MPRTGNQCSVCSVKDIQPPLDIFDIQHRGKSAEEEKKKSVGGTGEGDWKDDWTQSGMYHRVSPIIHALYLYPSSPQENDYFL